MVLRAQTNDDPDQQLEDLGKALEFDPENELALQLRGNIFLEQGKTDEAIADFRHLAETQGNNPLTLVLLAEKLVDAEKYEEALKVVDQAIEVNPDIPKAYRIRGQINLSLENEEAAAEDITRAIELEPRNLESLRIRANAYYSLKKYDEALKDVEKILVFDPQNGGAIYLRSFIYAAMEKYEPAIEDMKFLVAGIPDEPMFKNSLAMLYNSADMPRKAIRIYDEVLTDDPDDVSALRGRGDSRLSTGEHNLAADDYEKALKLDENDDGVLNNLAWVLATSPDDAVRNGKRSLELSLKAAELTEYKQAHILSTLAASYAEIGDFENALKWSEKSVELAEPGRQFDDLNKELASYQRKEAWRELKVVDEEKENAADNQSGDSKNESADEAKDKDASGDDKSEDGDKSGDGGGDGAF
jgi:tetratricopeptide (TPR) repeat protein